MPESTLLNELVAVAAERTPEAPALTYAATTLSYAALDSAVSGFASGLMALGLARGERVAIYLEKRFETVVASFGAPAAGGVFVPLNPLLKPEQVGFILRDCDVRVLVTSPERLAQLGETLAQCPLLKHVVLTSGEGAAPVPVHGWAALLDAPARAGHRVIDTDMTAILYTSGSTGRPKGVVLSHRNMVAGAQERGLATWSNRAERRAAGCACRLSFDAGFSQLTTGLSQLARAWCC